MTLGKRIAGYRKGLGLSQEALGERLGVSRQAVSKWETDAASPDMENLMALAREFGVSLAELTGTPEETGETAPKGRSAIWYFLFPILCSLGGAALVGLFLFLGGDAAGQEPAAPPPESSPAVEAVQPPLPAPASDFALLWTNSDGHEEFLELGEQEELFPFGTTLELTEPETVLDTDFGAMTHHIADCGAITVEYSHIEEDPVRESVTQLSTISQRVYTPRYIGPGSTERALLSTYGDELIYCLKEQGGSSLAPHDYFYEYCQGPLALSFYIKQGEVAALRAENLMDGADRNAIDHIYRFPVANGEPDFSLRQEPQQEQISDSRRVYIAFNQLVTNNDLSAVERYAYRCDVFGLLPYVDWQEYKICSGTYEQPDIGFFALMDWLAAQESYSPSEMLWLQMGSAAKGLDGAYTDMYCHVLSRALFYDPVEFSKQLSTDGIPEETMSLAVSLAAYDADYFPVEEAAAVKTIEEALAGGIFTEKQAQWAERLVDQLAE